MAATDPALTAIADGRSALSALYGSIESRIKRTLQNAHHLIVREFSLLEVLGRQRTTASAGTSR